MAHALVFVATSPFAVNSFLRNHLLSLAKIYDVTLCVNTLDFPLLEEISKAVRVRHVDISRKINLYRDFQALYQLIRCFREIQPNVVHSITPKGGLLAMLAGFINFVPNRWHTFTGQIWVTKKGLARFWLKKIDYLIAILASRIFADSESQCRLLSDEGVVGLGKVSVLGPGSISGVDLNRFHFDLVGRNKVRNLLGVREDDCVFIFVGRLVKDKGVFDLLAAIDKLASLNKDIVLWVVGPNEDNLLGQLQSLVQGSNSKIHWLGSTLSPEKYMVGADIIVLPSYREGFGSVIIEAAACGIPAIAYRIDGIIDAVEDGKGGILVQAGAVEKLFLAMKLLAFDENLRLQLGQQAQQRAIKKFSSNKVTKAWLNFYDVELNEIK